MVNEVQPKLLRTADLEILEKGLLSGLARLEKSAGLTPPERVLLSVWIIGRDSLLFPPAFISIVSQRKIRNVFIENPPDFVSILLLLEISIYIPNIYMYIYVKYND